ncbi:unnamed protein product [Amoebophrya sp. A120]|nr:unnamed protein product [Amoebophrya sp. A120]|eukprot:GSA120T00021161001.1
MIGQTLKTIGEGDELDDEELLMNQFRAKLGLGIENNSTSTAGTGGQAGAQHQQSALPSSSQTPFTSNIALARAQDSNLRQDQQTMTSSLASTIQQGGIRLDLQARNSVEQEILVFDTFHRIQHETTKIMNKWNLKRQKNDYDSFSQAKREKEDGAVNAINQETHYVKVGKLQEIVREIFFGEDIVNNQKNESEQEEGEKENKDKENKRIRFYEKATEESNAAIQKGKGWMSNKGNGKMDGNELHNHCHNMEMRSWEECQRMKQAYANFKWEQDFQRSRTDPHWAQTKRKIENKQWKSRKRLEEIAWQLGMSAVPDEEERAWVNKQRKIIADSTRVKEAKTPDGGGTVAFSGFGPEASSTSTSTSATTTSQLLPNECKVLVFVNTQKSAVEIAHTLYHDYGYQTDSIHGGDLQERRDNCINQFRSGETKILIATDVIARGVDISGITHVVLFDFPQQTSEYIHRIGRTARGEFGRGYAITFFEYWENIPEAATELIEILKKSEQFVPEELLEIDQQVKLGIRKPKHVTRSWESQWAAPRFNRLDDGAEYGKSFYELHMILQQPGMMGGGGQDAGSASSSSATAGASQLQDLQELLSGNNSSSAAHQGAQPAHLMSGDGGSGGGELLDPAENDPVVVAPPTNLFTLKDPQQRREKRLARAAKAANLRDVGEIKGTEGGEGSAMVVGSKGPATVAESERQAAGAGASSSSSVVVQPASVPAASTSTSSNTTTTLDAAEQGGVAAGGSGIEMPGEVDDIKRKPQVLGHTVPDPPPALHHRRSATPPLTSAGNQLFNLKEKRRPPRAVRRVDDTSASRNKSPHQE